MILRNVGGGHTEPPDLGLPAKQSPKKTMQDRESSAVPNTASTAGPIADYIASVAGELAHLAKRNGLEPLAYILDMARLEADQVSKNAGG